MRIPLFIHLVFLSIVLLAGTIVQAEPDLKKYETRYYTIYTDLDPALAHEACLRMTRMADEYVFRTKEFTGQIKGKLPFYLFKRAADYYEAGGMPGSAGVFNGKRLMAIAGEKTNLNTWHTVQHEGFHQFVHNVIGGEMPIWANEGLAEYFGEALFTGDGYISGLIPNYRLERIKRSIKDDRFMSIKEMLLLEHDEWNRRLRIENYDQAWSMVYFLAHAEKGKYQQAFSEFIRQVGRGKDWKTAWKNTFGDIDGFETKWKAYWTELPANPTLQLYGQATVNGLTSFLARATAQKQYFTNFEDFTKQGEGDGIKSNPDEALPASLFVDFSKLAARLGDWKLSSPRSNSPTLELMMEDGTRITGRFRLNNGRVDRVYSEITGGTNAKKK